MRVERFKAEHLDGFRAQPEQAEAFSRVTPAFAKELEGVAYSLVDDRVLACAGFCETDAGPLAWAWLAEDVPLLTLHRFAMAALSAVPHVFAYAAENWRQAGRWLHLLGFVETDVVTEMAGVPHRLYERRCHG